MKNKIEVRVADKVEIGSLVTLKYFAWAWSSKYFFTSLEKLLKLLIDRIW